jgi:hypothetical protein
MLSRYAYSCGFPDFSEDPLRPHPAYSLIMETSG